MTSAYRFTRYLSIETAGGATWHPDGNRIAFVSNSTGHYQVYTCEVSRGVTYPRKELTSSSDRCTDPRYLSDGTLTQFKTKNEFFAKQDIDLLNSIKEMQ